jgi:adenylate kinase family enzyme
VKLIWLVGPPGAGKSTFVRQQSDYPYIEFTDMLSPLTSPGNLTQGIMKANRYLIEIIRHVKNQGETQFPSPLIVVAGNVREEDLFPLEEDEEVWLIRPEKQRWLEQFTKRPKKYKEHPQFSDHTFSLMMYNRFETWINRPNVRIIETKFVPSRLGKIAEDLGK